MVLGSASGAGVLLVTTGIWLRNCDGLRAPEIYQALDFGIGYIDALQAHRGRRIRGLEEHIAAPEQAFGTGLVEDNARIDR